MLSQYLTACYGCSNWISRQRGLKDVGQSGLWRQESSTSPTNLEFRFWGILLFLSGVKQIHESFSLFCLSLCPTSGSRLSEVSFQKAPSNAAKKCSMICPGLFWTQLCFFVFFFPKNQFWVSQFVEASMCRVLCECSFYQMILVTNYLAAAVFSLWVCVCVIVPACVPVDTSCEWELTQKCSVWSEMLISLSGCLLTDVFRAAVSQSWKFTGAKLRSTWSLEIDEFQGKVQEVGRGAIGHQVVIHKSEQV